MEEVNEVLVLHARPDHVERAHLQSQVNGARQTTTGKGIATSQMQPAGTSREVESVHIAVTLIDGVWGFSNNLSTTLYAGVLACLTAQGSDTGGNICFQQCGWIATDCNECDFEEVSRDGRSVASSVPSEAVQECFDGAGSGSVNMRS